MKKLKLSMLVALLFGVVMFGCKPEGVLEDLDEELNQVTFNEADTHNLPTPLCNAIVTAPLVPIATPNPAAPWGTVEMTNTDKYMVVSLIASITIDQCKLWIGGKGEIPPSDANGFDLTAFQHSSAVGVNLIRYTFKIPLTELQECNSIAVWAHIFYGDGMGNIYLEENVIAHGTAVAGGFTNTFCNSMMLCGSTNPCEPWAGALNPCPPPVSQAPPTPVATTMTAGDCNKCFSENTVVFLECNSCVDVTSCKDLSNVVLGLADGSTEKFDGLTGKSGTFCSTNGENVITVWVKSGCYKSGDGPGFGLRFDGPCEGPTEFITGGESGLAANIGVSNSSTNSGSSKSTKSSKKSGKSGKSTKSSKKTGSKHSSKNSKKSSNKSSTKSSNKSSTKSSSKSSTKSSSKTSSKKSNSGSSGSSSKSSSGSNG